ncbi:CCR4-NOT transcription complex subunit 1 [Chionoecetes opilio]|uniref:CCR4-NOT transcription complex subunit 1 n=1 Tax=Chionoecetes opilio TaxID=41210 RepID=A0A8J5CZR6_CHIOP|nr:CCR4-NOT transcription complex subunit 1 [Chionoecetes opilio]
MYLLLPRLTNNIYLTYYTVPNLVFLPLSQYIKYGTQSQEPPSRPSGVVLPPSINVSPSTSVPGTNAALGGSTVVGVPPPAGVSPPVSSVAAKSLPPATAAPAPITKPPLAANNAVGSGKPTITTTNIETLLVATEKEEKITPPPEHIQDKVAFIFNNLAQVNLPQKVRVDTGKGVAERERGRHA